MIDLHKMSLMPYQSDWNRQDLMHRQDLMDPLVGISREMITPNLAPALARCKETVNVFSPLLATDIIETEIGFHVHVSN